MSVFCGVLARLLKNPNSKIAHAIASKRQLGLYRFKKIVTPSRDVVGMAGYQLQTLPQWFAEAGVVPKSMHRSLRKSFKIFSTAATEVRRGYDAMRA